MTLALPGVPRIYWKGVLHSIPKRVIYYIQARRLVDKGCLSYLDHIRDSNVISLPFLILFILSMSLWMCSL